MTVVFVAGSRTVSKLNAQIRERLDNIMNQHFQVLVGDANGADKAVQTYLAKCNYRNVVIHSMEECRNNVGGWPTQPHVADSKAKRDRHYYGIKDLAMAENASCGFMLWDGESKGTMTNVVNLLNAKKKVLLYFSPQKSFTKIGTFEDLCHTLHAFGMKEAERFLTNCGAGKQSVLQPA